jgi:hypothetical protein
MKRACAFGWAVAVALAFFGLGSLRAQDDGPDGDHEAGEAEPAARRRAGGPARPQAERNYRDFDEVTKGAQRIDGLFTLHRKDDHLYAEIRPHQFDEPMLVPVTIARGLAMAGWPINQGDEWVIAFHRAGDKVQVVRKNIYYKAPEHSPLEKAVKQNYTDSVMMALPIVSIHHAGGQSVVVDFADVFLTDFAQLGIGFLDRNRTTWHKVKGFANNVEIEVDATFGGGGHGGMHGFGGGGSVDDRGRTVVIHYSLAKMPDHGYHPRHADDRVGHFLNTTKDFGSDDPDTSYVRLVNRWRLEKADHRADLSPPKRQIVWYVEDNVPHEYRPAVEDGIREWNKAFEKIGFRDAIAVRWQQAGRDEFDPEDINYCTFRWITTSDTFAMSCLRSNPVTGEMIDGDVIFDASWIRYWTEQYAFLTGTPTPSGRGAEAGAGASEPLAVGRVISPILAAREGFGLPRPLPRTTARLLGVLGGTEAPRVELVPQRWNELEAKIRRRQSSGPFAACQLSYGMRPELGLAAIAFAEAKDKGKGKEKDKDEKDKDKEKKKDEPKLPEELIPQLIKEVVMHEVGHSLGLRHNFKASTMLSADQLNDKAITRVKGMSGSVMDYNPINIAPKGQKQGDYVTTTIGPYDYWAIEYAYKPIDGNEQAELKKIASRSPEHDLVFATDEDMYLSDDPLVNTYDLGSDTLRFAKDRVALAAELAKDLDAKVVRDGESFVRVREAFGVLMSQWGNAAHLVSSHVGGQSVARDHRGKGARDPLTPVPAARQRAAMAFLTGQILSDKAFRFSPALLRRLAGDTWHDWGSGGFDLGSSVDYPVNEEILSIQKIALSHCLSPGVLSRLENQAHQVESAGDALSPAEVFRGISDGVWSELADPAAAKSGAGADGKTFGLSTVRRNLQREHLRRLAVIALGNGRPAGFDDVYRYVTFFNAGRYPADARSLARMHLRETDARIAKLLARKDLPVDDTTRAHLEECRDQIAKVVDAGLQIREP